MVCERWIKCVIFVTQLYSDQYKRRMPEKKSTGTSESRVFKSNGLCMTTGIEEHLDDVFM